jgi:hypothetical protein
MRRIDNNGSASRGYPDRPRVDQLLPAVVLENAPAPVVEADTAARAAVATWRQAQVDEAEARRVAEQAPRLDEDAEQAAFNANRKLPTPTAPKRQEEYEAARRRKTLAGRAACEAIDELGRVVEAHKGDLLAGFKKTLEARHQRMLGLVDQLAGQAAEFEAEAGAIHSIHFGTEFPRPNRRGRLAGEVDRLVAAITARFADAVPRQLRILELVGTSPTEWNDVAAQLGVNQIEPHWCAARDKLVSDGKLRWVDANGVPLRNSHRLDGITAYLARYDGPPPEDRIQRARRERREREAAKAA